MTPGGGIVELADDEVERPLLEPYQKRLGRIAAATGASPVVETGSTEALLLRLEKGTLDLVIGEFDFSSPWSHRVTFVPTLAKPAGSEESIVTGVAARNGENGWIRLVHEQATGAGARR